jgi:hypothetical protein
LRTSETIAGDTPAWRATSTCLGRRLLTRGLRPPGPSGRGANALYLIRFSVGSTRDPCQDERRSRQGARAAPPERSARWVPVRRRAADRRARHVRPARARARRRLLPVHRPRRRLRGPGLGHARLAHLPLDRPAALDPRGHDRPGRHLPRCRPHRLLGRRHRRASRTLLLVLLERQQGDRGRGRHESRGALRRRPRGTARRLLRPHGLRGPRRDGVPRLRHPRVLDRAVGGEHGRTRRGAAPDHARSPRRLPEQRQERRPRARRGVLPELLRLLRHLTAPARTVCAPRPRRHGVGPRHPLRPRRLLPLAG